MPNQLEKNMMISVHIVVRGDVQGVGFRYFTQKSAQLFGINGWVLNKSDGTVEIDAEGSAAAMDNFIAAIKKGNRFSVVEAADTEFKKEIMHYRSFEIID